MKAATSTPSLVFLGRELRRAREAAGLSQAKLSELINYAPSLVSMVETADRMPKKDFTSACDKALNTNGLLTRILVDLVIRDGVPEWFWPWIDVERGATSLRSFQPLAIYGLLQTPAYARAILDPLATSDEHLEQLVNARLERQQLLAGDDPPVVVVIMDETVLRRPLGGPEVMRGQLEHLTELASRRNIHLHIIPSSAGAHAGLAGAFVLADLAGTNEVAYLETPIGGQVVDDTEQVPRVLRLWESLRAEALQAKQSAEVIKEVAKSWT